MASRNKRKKRTAPSKTTGHRPLPVRYALFFLAVVVIVVTLPLFAVWRQVYITNQSLAQEQLADSVAVLTQRATQLRMISQQLAGNERIERIARESLSLHYPGSNQIVIVRPSAGPRQSSMLDWGFLAVIRRSLQEGRG